MSKPKCYIAGPMRGYENCNFDAFDKAKVEVEILGYDPISPADLDRVHEGWVKYPPADFVPTKEQLINMILRDLEVIGRECGVIYMLKGWPASKGANAELALAKCLDLKVIIQAHYSHYMADKLPPDIGEVDLF